MTARASSIADLLADLRGQFPHAVAGAVTVCSIFMASTMSSGWPA